MKKNVLLIIVFVALLHPGALMSKSTHSKQYLGFSVGAGYSNIDLFGLQSELQTKGGFGFDLNFAYEYYENHQEGFWHSFKGGFQFMSSQSEYTGLMPDFTLRIKDTRGIETNCHYKDFSPLRESEAVYIFNPMYQFGYHVDGFYFGLGVKAIFGWMTGQAETSYKTSATYDEYIDDFEDMDDHFYKDHTVKSNESVKWKFGAGGTVSFEIGGYVKRDKRGGGRGNYTSGFQLIKFGAFVESGAVGYFNGENNSYTSLGTFDGNKLYFETLDKTSDATELKPLSYYQVNNSTTRLFVPFYAGVRLTILFNYPGTCVTCNRRQTGTRRRH